MALITADADAFSQSLANLTGLNVNVIRAWVILESAGGRSPAGPYNFLNIRAGSGWARYASANDAANAAAHLLASAPPSYGYRMILDTGSKGKSAPPAQQIYAIGISKWCYSSKAANHLCYGGFGAPNIVSIYNQLTSPKITPAGSLDPKYIVPGDFLNALPGGAKGATDWLKKITSTPSVATAGLTAGGALNPLNFLKQYGLRAVYVIIGLVAAGIGVVFIAKETSAGQKIVQKIPVAAKVAALA